jgi:pentatricopeptide repeat protein
MIRTYAEMRSESIEPNIWIFNIMIACFGKLGDEKRMGRVFQEMCDRKIMPSMYIKIKWSSFFFLRCSDIWCHDTLFWKEGGY